MKTLKTVLASLIVSSAALLLGSCSTDTTMLKRGKSSAQLDAAFEQYIQEMQKQGINVESTMIVKDGKVVKEQWWGEGAPDKPHVMFSVTKTFTSTAAGFAVTEGVLNLDDKVISFFPDKLPETVSENLAAMTVKDLLTMSCGHDFSYSPRPEDTDWVKTFLALPVKYKPGEYFYYNTFGSHMISAIIQKVTGEKLIDYLTPRLFEPLGIDRPHWDESPQGENTGGYGLMLKTEDLAKMGLLYLQEGKWYGKQILPAEWIAEASSKHVTSYPAGNTPESCAERGLTPENNDWMVGYGYQIWQNRPGGYRADGAMGQYIIVFPDKNAVIAVTANNPRLQDELNLIWDNLYPAL